MTFVLRLDQRGIPHSKWVSREDAATLYASGEVLWTIGEPFTEIRGGTSAATGKRSVIALHPIVATSGQAGARFLDEFTPPLSASRIYRRDRGLCLYCARAITRAELTLDHVIPECQGGERSYMNLVAACRSCNQAKGGRTPEQAGMALIAAPYVPSLFEHLILSSRHKILADQMEFLMARVGKNSRLVN